MTQSLKFLFAFALLFVLCGNGLAATWRRQDSKTLAWLKAVCFVNSQRGFAVGANGTILNTNDGGANWRRVPSGTTDKLRDIIFTDEKNGWILAERNPFQAKKGQARSFVLQTVDGGASWSSVEFADEKDNKTLNRENNALVRFVGGRAQNALWAVGERGAVWALNANKVWETQPAATGFLLLGGAALSDSQRWLLSADNALNVTSDAGKTWRATDFGDKSKAKIAQISFVNNNYGWAVGASGVILTTNNGGRKWTAQTSPTTADLFDVAFVNDREGWAAGDGGVLLHTVDGGANWAAEETKSTHRLERLFIVSNNNQVAAWAVGFGGTILASR